MHGLTGILAEGAADQILNWLGIAWIVIKVIIGFTLIIFIHELGHFLAAKWTGVRVDRFAIGFGPRLFGYRTGEGLRFGRRPDYNAAQLAERGYGETDYCLNLLPLGGYVKMLGQDDIIIDEKTDEVRMGDDPRAFTNRSVGARMMVASAGVIFNFIFAILLLMLVFLVGMPMTEPLIGRVMPGSPAAAAGIRPGDYVKTVDGDEIDGFNEIAIATMLADGAVRLGIERDGKPQELSIRPEALAPGTDPTIGIVPQASAQIAVSTSKRPYLGDALEPEDTVTAVNGEPVSNGFAVIRRLQEAAGKYLTLTVERRDPKTNKVTTLSIKQRARLLLSPDRVPNSDDLLAIADSEHLLGFMPRRFVLNVAPAQPGDVGGLRSGDVVAAWGSVVHPRYSEILQSIRAETGKPIHVTVERDGKPVELTVIPQSAKTLYNTARAQLGVGFGPEFDRTIVADVVPKSPAAALNLPRGAELLEIGGTAVHDWSDVFAAFRANAGKDLPIRYRAGDNEAICTLHVPRSILDDAGIPYDAQVLALDGKKDVKIEGIDQAKALRQYPAAVTALLRENIGKTVEVQYGLGDDDPTTRTAKVLVTEENANPWQLYAGYQPELELQFKYRERPVSAHGNPIVALQKGWRFTTLLISQMWGTVKKVSTAREVPTKNLSGPIGIAQIAYETSKTGLPQLLFFLAFLSANLAVINFLPLPVLDGGLMMFLILEKLRGKKLSIKTQMVSTMVGLAVIAVCFVVVIFQDIVKLL